MNAATSSPGMIPGSAGKIWTWIMVAATAIVVLICLIEAVNILFYDPYEEERFLFSFGESLAETGIESLTFLMFGSLALLLMEQAGRACDQPVSIPRSSARITTRGQPSPPWKTCSFPDQRGPTSTISVRFW